MINVLFRSLVKSVNLSSSFFGDYICHQKTSCILCSLPLGDRNWGCLKNKIPTIKNTSFTFWQLRTKLVQFEVIKRHWEKRPWSAVPLKDSMRNQAWNMRLPTNLGSSLRHRPHFPNAPGVLGNDPPGYFVPQSSAFVQNESFLPLQPAH